MQGSPLPLILMALTVVLCVAGLVIQSRVRAASTSGSGSSARDGNAKLFQANEHLQRALDEASQAEQAAASTGAGSGDRNARLGAAERARYHAGAARGAADRATAAAAGGTTDAMDAAAQARAAADRAQAAADGATYRANT